MQTTKKIIKTIWYCNAANVIIFSIICFYLGGRAFTGKIDGNWPWQDDVNTISRFYLSNGKAVSKKVYIFSYTYELMMYALMVFALVGILFWNDEEKETGGKDSFGILRDYYFISKNGHEFHGLVEADSMKDATDILNENEIIPEKIKVASKRERGLYSDNYIKRKIPKLYAVEIPDNDSENESENIK